VTTDIEELVTQVTQLASSLQLRLVPAIPMRNPNSGLMVLLDNDDLSAADFCGLAAAAKARLLYIQAGPFNAENQPEFDVAGEGRNELDGKVIDQLALLQQAAERFNGRIGQLALAFAVEGVLHYWTAAADWYENLMDRVAGLFPAEGLEPERLSDVDALALIQRLTGELVAIPAFRAAATTAQRQRIAGAQHAEISALYEDPRPGYRTAASRAFRNAADITAAEAERIYGEMEKNLPELAAELAATPQFRNAGTAGALKQRARDFLIEKAGGYSANYASPRTLP